MESEKRQAPRIKKLLVAQYSTSTTAVDTWDSTTIRNISTIGAMLFTDKNLVKDTTLKLLIKIPSDPFHWTEVKGQVVDSHGSIARIKFIEIGEKQKKTISDYIDWFLKNGREEE